MISVSEAMLNYINSPIREMGQYLTIKFYLQDDSIVDIDDEHLLKGSVKLTKKACSGSSFSIGECYLSSLTFTILGIANYNTDDLLNAKKVEIWFSVRNSTLDESVLLGVFLINRDSTILKNMTAQFNCDSMLSKLDDSFGEVEKYDSLYNIAKWCCDSCNLELGMSEDDFNKLSNNTSLRFRVEKSNSLDTYRDVVMFVAQLVCGFAQDDPSGRLSFVGYKQSNYQYNIDESLFKSSSSSQSYTTIDTVQFNNTMLFSGRDINSPYLLLLDENPLLSSETDELKTSVLDTLLDELKEVNIMTVNIQYNGNPFIELGDRLINIKKNIDVFITSLTWVYHGYETLASVGLDKRVNTKSRISSISSSGSSSGGSTVTYLKTNNAAAYAIKPSVLTQISNVKLSLTGYSVYNNTSIVLQAKQAGNVEITIRLNSVDDFFHPRFQVVEGYNLISFNNIFTSLDTSVLNRVELYILSDVTITIEAYQLESDFIANGLADNTGEWSGIFDMREVYTTVDYLEQFNILNYSDSIQTEFADRGLIIENELGAQQAMLYGSCKLENDSRALDGKEITGVGAFSLGNYAEWLIALPSDGVITISVKAKSSTWNAGELRLYIDGVAIGDQVSYKQDRVYKTFTTRHKIKAGERRIQFGGVDKYSYAPLLDSLRYTFSEN